MPARVDLIKWTPFRSLVILAALVHRPFRKMERPGSRVSNRPQIKNKSSTRTPCWLGAPRAIPEPFFSPSDWVPPSPTQFLEALYWAFPLAWWQRASQARTGLDADALQHGGNQRTSFSYRAIPLLCRTDHTSGAQAMDREPGPRPSVHFPLGETQAQGEQAGLLKGSLLVLLARTHVQRVL